MLPHVFTYISVSSTPATVLRLTSRSISIFLRTTTHSWQTWSQNWGDKSPAFSIKAALILWYRYVLPWFLNKKKQQKHTRESFDHNWTTWCFQHVLFVVVSTTVLPNWNISETWESSPNRGEEKKTPSSSIINAKIGWKKPWIGEYPGGVKRSTCIVAGWCCRCGMNPANYSTVYHVSWRFDM